MCSGRWYRKFFELNPREQAWRDAVVNYAESAGAVGGSGAEGTVNGISGGQILEYLRRFFPGYWYDPFSYPPGWAGASMGLTPDQEGRILADMRAAVVTAFEAIPGSKDAAPLRYPPPGTPC